MSGDAGSGPALPVGDRAARIAVVGGDGIGPEVTAEARRALEAVRSAGLARLEIEGFPHGADHYLETGETLSEATFERLRDDFDAILFGAVGDPRIPENEHARDLLLGLRVRLDLYVNLRPLRLRDPALSPLAETGTGIDWRIYRENTEGMYSGAGGHVRKGTADEVAVSEGVATRPGVERLVRAAFRDAAASAPSGAPRRVTLAEKSNAVPHMYGLWRRVFREVADEHPEVEAETRYVDALAMVREPGRFEVLVAENLLGDILSDLGAELVGGPGLAPSANVHPGRHGLYEPVHGSAPDLAGTGRANPMAAVLSAALMLRDLGFGDAADRVGATVDAALAEGVRTPDVGGDRTTGEVGRWIADRVGGGAG
ncbi:MAG: isocitrate/isopropylmalate dehydrogenase family protein [Gemmatimonadota bacterium]